jgi:hypothetical protein
MKDKKLNSYIDRANKIRKSDQRDAKKESGSRAGGKDVPRRGPCDFSVYWAMNRVRRTSSMRENAVISVLGGISIFSALYLFIGTVGWPMTPFLFYGRIVMAIAALAWLVYLARHQIYCIFTYPFYVNFDRRLSFPLTGWETLVSPDNFSSLSHWRSECGLTVEVIDDSEQFGELVRSVFYLFCHRTRQVYDAYETSDTEPWKFDRYELRGRCNCTIAGYLYSMIRRDLDRISRAAGNIREVRVSCSGPEREYQKVSFTSDSEGTSS